LLKDDVMLIAPTSTQNVDTQALNNLVTMGVTPRNKQTSRDFHIFTKKNKFKRFTHFSKNFLHPFQMPEA
jgi:hypothetical protein